MVNYNYKKQSFFNQMMVKHEIDKAIRNAKGPRDFDPSIRKIWRKLLKRVKEWNEENTCYKKF